MTPNRRFGVIYFLGFVFVILSRQLGANVLYFPALLMIIVR